MLNDRERKAIQLVLEGNLSKQEIATECGWKSRQSIYQLLDKEEAKEYMEKVAEKSVSEAVAILKGNANEAARELVKIMKGINDDIDKQSVYSRIQAITNILEKSGLSSKNITLKDEREKDNKVSDEDILSAIDEAREVEDNNKDNVIDIKKAK